MQRDSTMHRTLQKSKGDVDVTVKLFSVMTLKNNDKRTRTPKQKPVNPSIDVGISQINLGNPKDL